MIEQKKRYWIGALVVLLIAGVVGGFFWWQKGNGAESAGLTGEGGASFAEDVVIQVGEKKVTREEIMFYVLCVREQYEGYFGSEVWTVGFGNGKTFADMCKEDILNEIVQLKIITSMAESQGVLVTEDEADEIADTVREQMEEISDYDILRYHIDTELLESIYHDNYLSSKMFDVITSDVDTMVSDEEARQAEFQVLALLTNGTDKNRNEIAMSEEEREALREKAKELWEQADGGADFESLATVHSDLAETSFIIGRGAWKEEYDQAIFDEAAFSLKTGEISQVVDGPHGFYIIRCVNEMDEDATAQAKEAIINERQDTTFRKLYAEWAKEFEVIVDEKKWEEITFEDPEE